MKRTILLAVILLCLQHIILLQKIIKSLLRIIRFVLTVNAGADIKWSVSGMARRF